jgi:hypothetical protein
MKFIALALVALFATATLSACKVDKKPFDTEIKDN